MTTDRFLPNVYNTLNILNKIVLFCFVYYSLLTANPPENLDGFGFGFGSGFGFDLKVGFGWFSGHTTNPTKNKNPPWDLGTHASCASAQ